MLSASAMSKTVTLDTGLASAKDVISAGEKHGFRFAVVSVTEREMRGTPYVVHLQGLDQIPESGVWDESEWGSSVWADELGWGLLEQILDILASGGFPKERGTLTKGQLHLLRDAMILEAHIRENHEVFVSEDKRAFVNHGKRDMLEDKFPVKIFTRPEFLAYCAGLSDPSTGPDT